MEYKMSEVNIKIPEIGSIWQHYNGNYKVIMIANESTTRPEEYPITVIYQGENGKIWARKLENWHKSLTLLTNDTDLLHCFNREIKS